LEKTYIINGSPKRSKSTTEAIGQYIRKKLEEENESVTSYTTSDCLKNTADFENLYDAHKIIFICPLYIDSIPFEMVELMETMYKLKDKFNEETEFMFIVNSGFPEKEHSELALRMARNFSKKMKFKLLGALSLGGGGAIAGKELETIKKASKNVMKTIDIIAKEISKDALISQKAIELFDKKTTANRSLVSKIEKLWKIVAKKNGILKNLDDKPYL